MDSAKNILEQKYKNMEIVGADAFTKGGFVQVPQSIIKANDISDPAKIAYTLLLGYLWQNQSCFPGQQRLCEDWNKSERAVRNALKELEAAGYLEITKKGFGQVNHYRLFVTVKNSGVVDERT